MQAEITKPVRRLQLCITQLENQAADPLVQWSEYTGQDWLKVKRRALQFGLAGSLCTSAVHLGAFEGTVTQRSTHVV